MGLGVWESSDWNLIQITPSFTTADGLELYVYASQERKPEGYGGFDLYVKKRASLDEDWGPGENLGPTVNTRYDEALPAISPDGLELYFSGWSEANARPDGYGKADLWVTLRETREAPWGTPENLGPTVNSALFDARPILVGDGLVLFYESEKAGGAGSVDLYMMRRSTVAEPWGRPVSLGRNVNSSFSDEQAFLSPDGSTVYFHSNRTGGYGGYDIWQAPTILVVDFNGDGQVDGEDVTVMSQCWGQNEPLCDIGPMPWGDGTVDPQDLMVLAQHIGQDVTDPTLVAHWTLDETEGNVAHDNAGGPFPHDGTVYGDPLWQPLEGAVGGALAFDGLTNYAQTPFVVDPQAGKFSVLAWVKGGQPGQVIISQIEERDWLLAAPSTGTLMTGVIPPASRNPVGPLASDFFITDGNWHRIGFVYDGADRILYADGVEVARDTQMCPKACSEGLYIGCGSDQEAGTFWSGLIDDLRIYNRTVIP